jgi:hypothetical protein
MKFGGDWARFMALVLNRRQVNLLGYKGSGKSLLGYVILHEALKAGKIKGVASNVGVDLPIHRWDERLPPRGLWPARWAGLEGSGLYLDEAGAFMDNRSFAVNPTDLGRYTRKLRMLAVFMSATPIDRRFTDLQVTPDVKYGDKRWDYRFELLSAGGKVSEEGKITLWNPSQYFGKFYTDAAPLDDAGILAMFNWTLAGVVANAPPKIRYFRHELDDHEQRQLDDKRAQSEIVQQFERVVNGVAPDGTTVRSA